MKKNAQNLLEYVLIFAMIALASCAFVTGFDMKKLKDYIFIRPSDSADASKIKIEAMTQ